MAVLCTIGFSGLEFLQDPSHFSQAQTSIRERLDDSNCLRVQFASQYSGSSPGKFILMLEFSNLSDLADGASSVQDVLDNYVTHNNLSPDIKITEREIWFTSEAT